MAKNTKVVKIERGRYSATFQLARAMLSAATASLHMNRTKVAARQIDVAIKELIELRLAILK